MICKDIAMLGPLMLKQFNKLKVKNQDINCVCKLYKQADILYARLICSCRFCRFGTCLSMSRVRFARCQQVRNCWLIISSCTAFCCASQSGIWGFVEISLFLKDSGELHEMESGGKKRRVLSTNAWNSLTGDSLKCQAN